MAGACLIVDDSRFVREALKRTLVEEGLFTEVVTAADGAEALAMLESSGEGTVDLVLCDLEMPELDGFAFLARLRRNPRLADLPVIVLTGDGDVDSKVRALEAGASDYLTKPFADPELVARAKVHRNFKLLREELRAANQRLRELAIRDPLTGIYNRRHWHGLLERELDRARRHDRGTAVLIADLDHFKQINDRYGHATGDQVLIAVARTLEREVRSHDSVARLGGEEFIILLPETERDAAHAVAERLRLAVAALRFEGAPDLHVRASLGVAVERGAVPTGAAALVAAADAALYAAKRGGRDRVSGAEDSAVEPVVV